MDVPLPNEIPLPRAMGKRNTDRSSHYMDDGPYSERVPLNFSGGQNTLRMNRPNFDHLPMPDLSMPPPSTNMPPFSPLGGGLLPHPHMEMRMPPPNFNPTSKPLLSNPIIKPLLSTPTNKPLLSTPTSKPLLSTPTSKPLLSNPTSRHLLRNPTSKPLLRNPTRKPLLSNPTSIPLLSNPTSMPLLNNPTSIPLLSNPTSMPLLNSPTSMPLMSNPTSMPLLSNPTSMPLLSNPTSIPLPKMEAKEANVETGSPKVLPMDDEGSPQIQNSSVIKVKLPTLSKEAAKKMLKSFSSGLRDKKMKYDEDANISKKAEPVAKKKKVEKKSVIEQIMDEETRLKEVLVLHNCNAKYLGTGLAHLQSLMDDPVALKNFELKGRELRNKLDKNELHLQKEMQHRESSSHRSRGHRPERVSSTEKRKRKIVPRSWKQLKSLNISLSQSQTNEESDSNISPAKVEIRRSIDTRNPFSPLDDKFWVGLNMHKNLTSIRVNRFVGHSKKEYCGSMVRTTVTKPHITFSKNSGKISRHYMTRLEAKFRNKIAKGMWNIMKFVWEGSSNIKEYCATGKRNWYVDDWMELDHSQTLNTDYLTVSGDSALTELSKKYEDSELSGDEDTTHLPKLLDDTQLMDAKSVQVEITGVVNSPVPSEKVVKDMRSKAETVTTASEKECEFPEDSNVESEIADTSQDDLFFEDICTDSKEESVSPNINVTPDMLTPVQDIQQTVEDIDVDVIDSAEDIDSVEDIDSAEDIDVDAIDSAEDKIDTINGNVLSNMTLKEVKSLICSGSITKLEKRKLKEVKQTLRLAKKAKKKLKKERKRMRREKKKQRKLEKKLASQTKQELPEEESASAITEDIPSLESEEKPESNILYNPKEPLLSDNSSPQKTYPLESERYSPTSSPFYFSNESEPSPNDSFTYDFVAPHIEHSNLTTIVPVEDTVQKEVHVTTDDTLILPLERETSKDQNISSEISTANIDLNSIPTPPFSAVREDSLSSVVAIPKPVPPPKMPIPLPVPPVDPEYLQSITSNIRKDVVQQSPKDFSSSIKKEDAKPVTFRLSLNKTPTVKIVKPSVPDMFQDDIDELSKDNGKTEKFIKLFKDFSQIEGKAPSLDEPINSDTKRIEIKIYSPSHDTESKQLDKVLSGEDVLKPTVPADNKELVTESENNQERPHSNESKHSASPSRESRKQSSTSPIRRYRDRPRSRSPERRSSGSYSRSRRSSPKYKRSRSPVRSGGRYRDRSSRGYYDKRSHSPSPKRSYYGRSRDSDRKQSPLQSATFVSKYSTHTSEPIPSIESKRIEAVTNVSDTRKSFNINLSEIVMPSYDELNYSSQLESPSYDNLTSPKRPSLTERLREEHGVYLEDSPSTFDNSNSFDSQPVDKQQLHWNSRQVESIEAPARVIQVGNVLQILPQELPLPEEPAKKSIEQRAMDPVKPHAPLKQENHSIVPLSPSFSPPPEGRISPLPPPSPIKQAEPREVVPPVVAPVITGPIPGLSSEALISAAAAASAASNVPLAQLISVLQEQNLLPKSVPLPEQAKTPAKESSPEPPRPPESDKGRVDIETLRKANRERKVRKRKEKERRRREKKLEKEQELARQIALQQAEEDDDEALLKEAISEVADLDGPMPDYYLMDDEEEIVPMHKSLSLPPPEKGILMIPTYRDGCSQPQKSVCFADGIIPGDGTSASGEDNKTDNSPVPAKSVKRKQKKDRPATKKTKTKEIKMFDITGDGICSPPPPPDYPPPPDVIKLYPGWSHCTYTSPETVTLYTQQLLDPMRDHTQETVIIPPGMVIHATGLISTAGS